MADKAKGLVASRDERQRLGGITQILEEVCRDHQFKQEFVALNVPPAWVHHLRFIK